MAVTLESAWKTYEEFTTTASTVARQVAFGLAGVAWVLRPDASEIPRLLVWALGAVVGYFTLDMLQYVLAAEQRRKWIERTEREHFEKTGTIVGEFAYPIDLDRPTRRLFRGKLGFLGASAALLFAYVLLA